MDVAGVNKIFCGTSHDVKIFSKVAGSVASYPSCMDALLVIIIHSLYRLTYSLMKSSLVLVM